MYELILTVDLPKICVIDGQALHLLVWGLKLDDEHCRQ